MEKYTFKVDENNNLVCAGNVNGKGIYKRGINAIKLLKKLNKCDLPNVNMDNNNLVLSNDKIEVTLENASNFLNSEYLDNLKDNKETIEETIKYEESSDERVMKVINSVIASGAMIIAALGIAASAYGIKKETDLENAQMKAAIEQQIEEQNRQREERLREQAEIEEIKRQEQILLAQIQAEENAIAAYNEQKETILEQTLYIDVNQNWEDERRYKCYEYYGDAIDEIAPRFGLSPNIIKAMASQEGGGYLPNVMQVNNGWYYKTLEYYDNELGEWHYITCTSEETHDTEDTLYISLSDPNISVYFGCAVLVRSINRNNGNLLAGMIEYNRGNADGLVNQAASSEGVSHDEYLEDYYNSDIQYYDYNYYIQSCLKFMDNDPITYTYVDKETGEIEYITWYPVFKNTEEEDVVINNIGEEPERVLTVSDNSISNNSVSDNKTKTLSLN